MTGPPFPPRRPVPRRPALLLVAHGSRDARHAASVDALAREIRRGRPALRVATGYLDLTPPAVPAAVEELARRGHRDVVAVPLLLVPAFHARTDLPALLRGAPAGVTVRQAAVLGASPLLADALERRLYESGLTARQRGSTGVVLAVAGSASPRAAETYDALARTLERRGWRTVRPAFASAAAPGAAAGTLVPAPARPALPASSPTAQVHALRAAGVRRVAVAQCVIAPGRLADRVRRDALTAEADHLTEVLGPAPELARLVLRRFRGTAGVRPAPAPAALPAR